MAAKGKLMQTLRAEIEKYAGEAINGYSYLAESKDKCLLTTISIGEYKGRHVAFADLIVRIIDDKIVIDDDRNSDPFYEALLEAGIPCEKIILAYADEPVPVTVLDSEG